MYKILRTVAALAVAVLMTLAMLVPAAAAGSADRPFKGDLAGGATVVPDASCPFGLRTVMWASGQVTHFGLTTMTGTHCTPPIGAASFSGVQTFVAANGDRLEMTYTATVEQFEPVEGAFMTGPGQTVITGGTGRFADASGDFVVTMRGILHFTTPMELWFDWDDEISY
jgi:hypothetical protein